MWLIFSLISVVLSTLYALLQKNILNEGVNVFDITIHALPVYLLIVAVIYASRRDAFTSSINSGLWWKIALLTVIGSINLYVSRTAQKEAPNPGFALAIMSASIVPLTLLYGKDVTPRVLAGIVAMALGAASLSMV